jgi:cytochrome c oxidase cbb3-type subunit 3/ubiquinol-cytochrome c reductase cytochrome c subunit
VALTLRRTQAAWAFLRAVLIAGACLASGTLQCGGHVMTEPEARGATLYHRMCAVCHGADGSGYAADNAPAIANPHYLAVVNDHFLETSIGNGRAGTTMSAWSSARGGPLGYKDTTSLVAYLRTFELSPHVEVDDAATKGDAKRGASEFKARCASCHGEKGAGGPYVHIGNPDLLAAAGNGMLRATIARGREGTLMPAFGRELGDGGVEDIVAALRSWQSEAPREVRPAPAKPPPLPLGPVPLNPKGPEPQGFKPQPATTPADVVKRELDRGARMALLDARAQSDYLGEHIKGAVSVPFFDPEPYLAQLPKDAWLVCYCACPHAESGQLARKLEGKGFTKVTVLDEGLGVWRARKYGTSSGPDP